MDIAKNDQGFVFITMLFTITIFFMTMPLVSSVLKAANDTSHYDEISVLQFFYFLRDDMIKATDYAVTPSMVKLSIGDTVVTFEKYGTLIRRQVDGQGHEIYLRKVKEFSLIPLPYGFHAVIKSLNGETYEKTIALYQ